MIESLTQEKLVVILDGWAGQEAAVRVVTEANDLLAVFCAELGSQSADKHPSAVLATAADRASRAP